MLKEHLSLLNRNIRINKQNMESTLYYIQLTQET